MKKIVCATLALTVALFSLSFTPILGNSESYTDTKTTDWFYSSLDTLSDNNIIKGFPDGTFKPNDKLNIDQFITILCRLTDNDVGIADGYWAQNYINFAKSEGWLDDMSISNYQEPINRNQTARLSSQALGYDTSNAPSELQDYAIYISDYNNIPLLYRDDVLVNYILGLTTGYPDGTFKGNNTLTRAEAAVISHRIFDPNQRKQLLNPSKTSQLLELFNSKKIDDFTLLTPEVTMPVGMMLMTPPTPSSSPLPISSLPLTPSIAVITENVLADAIIELSDQKSTNLLSAGYNKGGENDTGILTINLLSKDYESILIYSAEDGSSIITLDLMLMTDENGNLRDDASDLILLICTNINKNNGQSMHDYILEQYDKRSTMSSIGVEKIFDKTNLRMNNLVHDHNVTKVTFTPIL